MDLNNISFEIINIILFLIRLIQPFFAIFIVYQCFTSLRKRRRDVRPLVMLKNMVTNDDIPVVYWENSIGRSKTSDIMLGDPTISRDHAVLYRRDEGWIIDDTGSKSGVHVNEKLINGPKYVHIGDTITIGTTLLALKKAQNTNSSKKSWFFDKKIGHRTTTPFLTLFMVTIFHFFVTAQLIFSNNKVSVQYFLPFVLITISGWSLYFVSILIFKRVSFELETLAFFFSGTGIMLISGQTINNTYVQIAAMAMGMVLFCFMIWFMEIPDRVMKWRLTISILAVALLAFTLILGSTIHGSKNWISLGFTSIQPSEFVKIALILVGTSALSQLQTAKNMTEFIVFSGLCIGALFLMSDFGTACIFFITFIIIAFMRSGNIRTIIFILAAAAFGVFIILQFKPYIIDRFSAWRNVWQYIDTTGYQQTRVLSYSASGGLFGLGLGNGFLKTVFASTSDLVFGILCEEMGIIFALLIPISIAGLAFYAIMVSSTSRSTLYSIAACSAAGMLVFQTCLNIFGATDILPLTGVTLPFISLGGSSMISVWALLSFIKVSDERTYSQKRGES